MIEIDVLVSEKYKVKIEDGSIYKIGEYLKEIHPTSKVAIVSDQNVADLYIKKLDDSLKMAGFSTIKYTFPPGEQSKSFSELSKLLEFLAEKEVCRQDIILALGGGVTGDLAGFAAASFLRGVSFVQVPTSLLAAVDSSVGGKTAVNLRHGKNLAGAFWQPKLVVFDPNVLNTLSQKELSAGAAECVKYAMLYDEKLLEDLTRDGLNADWSKVVAKCVYLKAEVVRLDEKEQDLRRFLNFGHTVGHAIELLSGFSIPHGEGVAIGMLILSRAAEKMGIAKKGLTKRLILALDALNLPTNTNFSAKDIALATMGDKKRQGKNITIILPKDVGNCFLKEVSFDELYEMIKIGMEE